MKLKQLLTEDRAVSPVIGVILMVAITVILAAVIGTFVLGLGDNLSDTSPTVSIDFDVNPHEDTSNNTYNVTATHAGGDTVPDNEQITLAAAGSGPNDTASGFSINDQLSIVNVSGETTVRVTWTSSTGESTATLGTTTTPPE